ncbi:MAG: ribosomal RNA small subunit methyltransferase [Planctomycetota bacterium]|nr:MAG: ribosomal RNA small subunit methyltransferase [Planctomycetota bacterium]
MSRGTLFVVATPIGNLEDITLRAIDVLKTCALIAAEDTRTAKKLTDRHAISTPLMSFHEHSGPGRVAELVKMLEGGKSVALISEAGTPGLSDPGEALIHAAAAAGIAVVPIPGAAAFVVALSASGLPMARVAFEGFLPAKPADRRKRLASLARESRTMAFYEAPHRIAESLADMRDALGAARRACVARELTKIHEEFERATLGQLAERWAKREPRGEFTVLIEGSAETEEAQSGDVEGALRAALAAGKSVSAAAKEVAAALGRPRNVVYAMALRLEGRS